MQIKAYKMALGDSLFPLNALINHRAGSKVPIDLEPYDLSFLVKDKDGATVLDTDEGITKHPTQPFEVDVSISALLIGESELDVGNRVKFASSGTLPAGLTAGTTYYVVETADEMAYVSETKGGERVTITTAGTGNHTFFVVGSAQVVIPDDTFTVAGDYRSWWKLTKDGKTAHIPPDDDGVPILVVEPGSDLSEFD